MPDEVAAALAKIRERHYKIKIGESFLGGSTPGVCVSDRRRWPCDAHILGEALEEVLKLHSLTARHQHTEPCGKHRYRGLRDRANCRDCRVVEWTGCETCRDELGNPARAEDCRERETASRALLGEEDSGE